MPTPMPYTQFENEDYSDDQLDLPPTSREIKVYRIDGTYETVSVTPSTTSEQVCSQIGTQIFCQFYGWSLVEVWKDEGIERTLEDHESVLVCYHRMEYENEKNRILVLRLNNKMFHMFKQPEQFSLYKTLDIGAKKQAKVVKKVLNGDTCPLHFGQVWVFNGSKTRPLWDLSVLLLKDKNLYISVNHKNIVPHIRRFGISYFRNSIMVR